MPTYLHASDCRRRLLAWACGLLALAALAACGTSGQPADATSSSLARATAGAAQPAPATAVRATPLVEQATPPAVASAIADQLQAATPAAGPASPPTIRPHPTTVPVPPKPLRPTRPPAPVAPTVPAASAGGWQTYRSDIAEYRIDYPPEWTAREQSSEDGANITQFAPAAGGPGMVVTVFAGAPPATEPPEQPNQTCQRVTAGGLAGRRCLDSASLRISTTLAGKGRTYIIATTGKGIDAQIYQQFIDSFTPIRT